MNIKTSDTHHILFADRNGFVLLVRDDIEAPYALPSFHCPSGQLSNDRITIQVALTAAVYVTSIEFYPELDLLKGTSSYLKVNYRGPLRLKNLEGYWADPTHLVQNQTYLGLNKALQHWGLTNSPADRILHLNQGTKPPAFLRGMIAGFDYHRVFRNPEILSENKEQYMLGWKAARKKVLH